MGPSKKGAFPPLSVISKTERRGCQKWSSSLFLKTLSPSKNLKIEEISTNRKLGPRPDRWTVI
jgi:hypothetical protein